MDKSQGDIQANDPTTKGDVIGSVTASIRESKKNPDLIDVKIVFVKDRHSKNWLAVLSTNTNISDDEIIRIYGKRWDIGVPRKGVLFQPVKDRSRKEVRALQLEWHGGKKLNPWSPLTKLC